MINKLKLAGMGKQGLTRWSPLLDKVGHLELGGGEAQ